MNDHIIAGDPAPTNPTAREQLLARIETLKAERDELLSRLHTVAGAKYWTNEDGRKIVFVEDIAHAVFAPLGGCPMSATGELLTALGEHDASGWILDIHLDDCESAACIGCDPQHLAEKAAAIRAEEHPLLRIQVLTEVADLLMEADETAAALLVDRLIEGGDQS